MGIGVFSIQGEYSFQKLNGSFIFLSLYERVSLRFYSPNFKEGCKMIFLWHQILNLFIESCPTVIIEFKVFKT